MGVGRMGGWTVGNPDKGLFFEQAQGNVKALEKSTSPVFNLREFF
jgi:hypothetical protein